MEKTKTIEIAGGKIRGYIEDGIEIFDTKVEILNNPFGEERAVWDDIIKFRD